MRHNVTKMDSDEALVVKGTMIIVVPRRQLTSAKTKEKGKEKESTPKLRATIYVPTMPTDSVTMLTEVIQNQEVILHKLARLESKNITLWQHSNNRDVAIRETLVCLSPKIKPAFPTFPVDLFSRDFSQPASPKVHSSTSSDAIEPILPAVDELAKTTTPPE
ncbi:hypothetical protein V6N12_009902 [Hibiscus sabdariffa]|uniref:Uncharacterized protein n=1 Tax=Hibiscus sabdariffa TaxID=183260 RepID=A0ABR2EC33_9ROSI